MEGFSEGVAGWGASCEGCYGDAAGWEGLLVGVETF